MLPPRDALSSMSAGFFDGTRTRSGRPTGATMSALSYQVSRLENGLTVATARQPHMASVCLGLWFKVGGRHEPAPLNGISHFIEHMLFKGTRRRNAREISEAVEGLGGYLNAF